MKQLKYTIAVLSVVLGLSLLGLGQSTISNAPYNFNLNGLLFGSGTSLPTACGANLIPPTVVGSGGLYWQSSGGGQTGLTGEGWYECIDGAFTQFLNQVNMFQTSHTYAQHAIQIFSVSGSDSDLVVGQVAADPCCSLSVGSLYMISNGLHGNPHLNFFDGNIGQTNITASDSACDLSNGCSGVSGSQVALVNSPSFVTPNVGDATGTSLTLNLTTGDFFDLQAGLTTPNIQATPQAGHIKAGYGSDNRFQISNNGGAFSDAALNSDLPVNIQFPIATSVLGGVGIEYASGTSATQTGSLGSQTIVATTPAATTWYEIKFYLVQVGLGTNCTGNTNVKTNVIYTDPLGAGTTTQTTNQMTVLTTGTANTPLVVSGGAGQGAGSFLFQAKASTSISISTTYTQGSGCNANLPSYQVSYLLEKK